MAKVNLPGSDQYDEMMLADGNCRENYKPYYEWLSKAQVRTIEDKRKKAELLFHKVGITFNVYGDNKGAERLIPFDPIPRIIPAQDWKHIEAGILQRVTALNMFLHDIYHNADIVRAGIIPEEQIFNNSQYQVMMRNLDLVGHIYSHISGVDIIRNNDGKYYVLEDNLRTPSGVSYMIEDRKMMMRLYPEVFVKQPIAPVEHYPNLLLDTLKLSTEVDNPCVVVMTPGRFNSAYFEHSFLAQQMGIDLVEGVDLFVRDEYLYMRTTQGPKKVDVIYRRIDDEFIDPLTFNPDSMLGVAGLTSVYKQGHVVIANAIGTGVADDKSIYPYVGEIIKFYLGEEPILNNVPTYMCRKEDDLKYVLEHLKDLVVKEVHGSGGYGMLVGPKSTKAQIDDFYQRVKNNPTNYVAQPTLTLSSCPTFVEEGIAPRHIDLRPFVLSCPKGPRVVPGGLTRVALKKGSLVVNSSQGGGTKDTWVLEDETC
ncbi:MAG: circularly permuted type 2 ATP-grasp protein [Succinivibrionaceae bacterium]|nr:circularly permuted type 2 ATP-grasp protein [Succinivibrionaceae bacterium]MEE1339504.1 circularly permuted type 2 ATP-grasp protein [Succinivibrionaceae bacterium]